MKLRVSCAEVKASEDASLRGWRDGRGFRGGHVDKRIGWDGLVVFCGWFGDEEIRGKCGCGEGIRGGFLDGRIGGGVLESSRREFQR